MAIILRIIKNGKRYLQIAPKLGVAKPKTKLKTKIMANKPITIILSTLRILKKTRPITKNAAYTVICSSCKNKYINPFTLLSDHLLFQGSGSKKVNWMAWGM